MNKGFKWIAIGTCTLLFVWGDHAIFGPWHYSQSAKAGFLIIAAIGCIGWGSLQLTLRFFGASPTEAQYDSLASPNKGIVSRREIEHLAVETRYLSAAFHVFEIAAKLDLSLNHGRIGEDCSIDIAHDPEIDEQNLVEPMSPVLERMLVGPGPRVVARRSRRSIRVAKIFGEIRRDGAVLCFSVGASQNDFKAIAASIEERVPSANSGTGLAWLQDLLGGAINLPWESLARERVFGARGELEWSESAQIVSIKLCGEKIAERRLAPALAA